MTTRHRSLEKRSLASPRKKKKNDILYLHTNRTPAVRVAHSVRARTNKTAFTTARRWISMAVLHSVRAILCWLSLEREREKYAYDNNILYVLSCVHTKNDVRIISYFIV